MTSKSQSYLLGAGLLLIVGWFAGTACFPLPFGGTVRPESTPEPCVQGAAPEDPMACPSPEPPAQ